MDILGTASVVARRVIRLAACRGAIIKSRYSGPDAHCHSSEAILCRPCALSLVWAASIAGIASPAKSAQAYKVILIHKMRKA